MDTPPVGHLCPTCETEPYPTVDGGVPHWQPCPMLPWKRTGHCLCCDTCRDACRTAAEEPGVVIA